MSKYLKMLSLLAAVALLATSGAWAQEAKYPAPSRGLYEDVFAGDTKRISNEDVPKRIWQAARAVVGDLDSTEAGLEIGSDGTILYVLDFQRSDGRSVSADFSSDGRLVSVEHSVKMEEVPRAVQTMLREAVPNLVEGSSEVEKSVRADGVVYEMVGTVGNREFYAEIPAHAGYIIIVWHHIWFPPIPIPIPLGGPVLAVTR